MLPSSGLSFRTFQTSFCHELPQQPSTHDACRNGLWAINTNLPAGAQNANCAVERSVDVAYVVD